MLARVDRLKECKLEAEQSITAYRNEMESKYQEQLKKVDELSIRNKLSTKYIL